MMVSLISKSDEGIFLALQQEGWKGNQSFLNGLAEAQPGQSSAKPRHQSPTMGLGK